MTPNGLRRALDKRLGRWVDARPDDVLAAFATRDALLGRPITWTGGPEGLGRSGFAEGVDERGNLVVRGQGGERLALGSGEVQLRLL